MADKEFLERMLSMLPEEFQDIYDDTIPEAKEIRKKMGKKVSSVKSYSCATRRAVSSFFKFGLTYRSSL